MTWHVLEPPRGDPRRALAADVAAGLAGAPKRLPSKYFYDAEGSRLFRRIEDLDEYYPTRTEAEILRAHGPELLAVAGDALDVVDLGAGDGRKTLILLEFLHERGVDFRYVPVDICEAAVRDLVGTVRARLPDAPVEGLVSEYARALEWLRTERAGRRRLVLFLGSSIGNLDGAQATAFLRGLWTGLRDGDHVLVGFDLKKDPELLWRAYNDREGVTARFDLNLLARINRELGADFDLARFRHYAPYDPVSGAVRTYLVSREPQTVRVAALERAFTFDAWEPLHTEVSHKYLPADVHALAAAAGFTVRADYTDRRAWFLDSLWCAEKG